MNMCHGEITTKFVEDLCKIYKKLFLYMFTVETLNIYIFLPNSNFESYQKDIIKEMTDMYAFKNEMFFLLEKLDKQKYSYCM